MKQDTYRRAFNHIVAYIVSHSAVRFDSISEFPAKTMFLRREPVPGELLRIEAAMPSDWNLSWHVRSYGNGEYLLKSAMTGETCKWSNIGVSVFDPSLVSEMWKWADKQFEFFERFGKVCEKVQLRPRLPVFDGTRVKLETRISFSNEPITDGVWFDNWKTLRVKDLTAFVDEQNKAFIEKRNGNSR